MEERKERRTEGGKEEMRKEIVVAFLPCTHNWSYSVILFIGFKLM